MRVPTPPLAPLPGLGVPLVAGPDGRLRPARRVRTREEVESLEAFDPEEHQGPLADTLRALREEVGDRTFLLASLLGPLSLAEVLVDGGPSRSAADTRLAALQAGEPGTFEEALERLVDALLAFAAHLLRAGADGLEIAEPAAATWPSLRLQGAVSAAWERLLTTLKALGAPILLRAPVEEEGRAVLRASTASALVLPARAHPLAPETAPPAAYPTVAVLPEGCLDGGPLRAAATARQLARQVAADPEVVAAQLTLPPEAEAEAVDAFLLAFAEEGA